MDSRPDDLIEDDDGATMVEYALVLGLVAVAMLPFAAGLSGAIRVVFSSMTDRLR